MPIILDLDLERPRSKLHISGIIFVHFALAIAFLNEFFGVKMSILKNVKIGDFKMANFMLKQYQIITRLFSRMHESVPNDEIIVDG